MRFVISTVYQLNGWSNFNDLPNDLDDAHRDAVHQSVHEEIHCYFEYLQKLGVVQVNLIHLSDNAFGGMALYDHFFIVNSFVRNGRLPDTEDGYLEQPGGPPRGPGEAISMPVSVPSALWAQLESLAAKLGFTEVERFRAWDAEQWFGIRSPVTPSD